MKKGLRLIKAVGLDSLLDSNLALMKKGLRRASKGCLVAFGLFKPCPDEEGIKTKIEHAITGADVFKPCPDEEGIKTAHREQC